MRFFGASETDKKKVQHYAVHVKTQKSMFLPLSRIFFGLCNAVNLKRFARPMPRFVQAAALPAPPFGLTMAIMDAGISSRSSLDTKG